MIWLKKIYKDLLDMGFEESDSQKSMVIVGNKYFFIRAMERNDTVVPFYDADISVIKNFDRWANSTDWYVKSVDPFSAKALMDVVKRFYKQKYYNPGYSDFLNITENVMVVQKIMNEKYCPICIKKVNVGKVVLNKYNDGYLCPMCNNGFLEMDLK